MPRIFVIDDEQDLCEILRFNLESNGFEVQTATSAEEALAVIHAVKQPFDLLLLDVMMERLSGYDLVRKLRAEGNQIPVIFLTARTSDNDQLEGFGTGADDYINKPFSFATVLARIKAVLKRTSSPQPIPDTLHEGLLSLDTASATVSLQGERLPITRKEYQILRLLLQNKGRYFSREQILEQVWDDDICVGDRSVDVHIARLRKKLGPLGQRIVNRTGFGYAFES